MSIERMLAIEFLIVMLVLLYWIGSCAIYYGV